MDAWSVGATEEPTTTLVSLVGAGGLGKSFIAREARKPSSGHPAELVLWVDSAIRAATASAYAETAEKLGIQVPGNNPDRGGRQAKKLVARLQEVW